MASLRPNEHLAVLLPKSLWKPDSAAVHCDNFFCRVAFSIFERRHHCRKCGGIYCHACASRCTPLIDASNLEFVSLPRNVPIAEFESPTSQITNSRVCEDCFDLIHGCPTTPRTPEITRPAFSRVLSHPISVIRQLVPQSSISSESSLSSSSERSQTDSVSSPSIACSNRRRSHALGHNSSSSSLTTQSSSDNSTPSRKANRSALRTSKPPLPDTMERSYGELDAYPLRKSSVLCKATGGGRWEPKPIPVLDFYRVPIPGGKAPYEIVMEREEKLEQLRRENPVLKHGEFQIRVPKVPEPTTMSSSINRLSTF